MSCRTAHLKEAAAAERGVVVLEEDVGRVAIQAAAEQAAALQRTTAGSNAKDCHRALSVAAPI